MPEFIPWSSQSLDQWAEKYAQGKFIELGGRRTHYLEKGDGPPVILLHGFFYDSYLWTANIDALARHFKVYALDLWGFGYSTREPLDYGYPLYAEQVLLFMDSLGLRRASLVGQSMGAGTAVLFGVQHRPRVEKLVLVAAAGMPNPLIMLRLFSLPGIGEFLEGLKTDALKRSAFAYGFMHNHELLTDTYFENVTRHQKIQGSARVALTIQRKQFFDTLSDTIHRLATLEVPTLLVWGRQDKATPLRLGRQMHEILQGSRLEILDNAGHVPNYERADAFNPLVVDFLRGPTAT